MEQDIVVGRLLAAWRAEIDSVPIPAGLPVGEAMAIVARASARVPFASGCDRWDRGSSAKRPGRWVPGCCPPR
ncbi:hypothetical protein ACPZ19_10630 [Amycolatopsis lurida]